MKTTRRQFFGSLLTAIATCAFGSIESKKPQRLLKTPLANDQMLILLKEIDRKMIKEKLVAYDEVDVSQPSTYQHISGDFKNLSFIAGNMVNPQS